MSERFSIAATGLVMVAIASAAILASPAAAQGDARIALPGPALAVTRPPEVELRTMDIVITPAEIRGRYVFHNRSDRDIGAIASFPAPDLDGAAPGIGYTDIPAPEKLNFMEFSASVGGQPATLLDEQFFFGAGLNRTPLMKDSGAPMLPPASEGAWRALARLDEQTRHDLWVAGLIDIDKLGDRLEPRPRWLMKSTWYWPQVFPAGKETVVEWRHRPSVAVAAAPASASMAPDIAARRAATCAADVADELARKTSANGGDGAWLLERALRQRIATGPTYAGPAASITITIDTGADGVAAAACFSGLEQVGPHTWRAQRENMALDEDLEVLFLSAGAPESRGVPPAEEDVSETPRGH